MSDADDVGVGSEGGGEGSGSGVDDSGIDADTGGADDDVNDAVVALCMPSFASVGSLAVGVLSV